MGLYFTAVRETFEESGILLANFDVDISRNFAGRFNGYREEIHDGVLTLKDLAVKENIQYALNLLMPYARWITPEFETKRFDTRFFLARKPKHQHAEHDRKELVESLWITPEEALKKNSSAAGQGRVIQRVEIPPRKAGQPPGSESLESDW